MKRPVRIGNIVADNPTLGALVTRARQLQTLERVVRGWLPPALAPHVGVATIREETLVLTVRSAAWATKLRFEVPAIVAAARTHDTTRTVRDVKIKVLVEGGAV